MTLRDGLLADLRIAVGGDGAETLTARLQALGAGVEPLGGDALTDEESAAAWAAARAPLDALVHATGASFGAGGPAGLQAALRLAWLATRAVATGALIPADRPGRILLIAPRAGAGPHAEAARAGLVNLARTLSVEWARFAVTAVAILPGAETGEEHVAELACFLASRAGGYFSGCRFDLGTVSLTA